jgi:antitoxin (DNA-binding transcriptional repressor) of toxin-antitoxin stability system
MKTVGIRELKNHLGKYLRQVRVGESLLVTSRGEVVAELSPPTRGLAYARLPAGLMYMCVCRVPTEAVARRRSG